MGITLLAADGRTWTVKRRILWPRWRGFGEPEGAADAAWWAPDEFGGFGALILAAVLAVIILAVLPLALFLIEVLLVLVGILLLRSVWVVEAWTLGPPTEKRAWKVRGWRAGTRAVEEVASELRAGVDAAPATGEPLEA